MALTTEQKIAREQEKLNKARSELRRLRKQAEAETRAQRNHRLIEAAATCEAEAKSYGLEGWEIDARTAGMLARFWFEGHEHLTRVGGDAE